MRCRHSRRPTPPRPPRRPATLRRELHALAQAHASGAYFTPGSLSRALSQRRQDLHAVVGDGQRVLALAEQATGLKAIAHKRILGNDAFQVMIAPPLHIRSTVG